MNTLLRMTLIGLAFAATTPAVAQPVTAQSVVEHYATIVSATYEDTLAATKKGKGDLAKLLHAGETWRIS